MSNRRGWTQEEDRILKLLKEERKVKKWSSIARLMDFEFNMCGRNGKQCRQRYNNHLETGIVQKKLSQEQERLFQQINQQIGNKWSVIARAFKGRTANYLKNQLYSKLRKSIRKLNKFIKQIRMKELKPFKLNIVYKIVQSNDFKIFEKERHENHEITFYSQLKEKLFRYAEQPLVLDGVDEKEKNETIKQSRQLIREVNEFVKKYEALHKKIKKPRKRYLSEDDIILNSLSNNKIGLGNEEQILKITQNIQEEQDESKMDESETDESSSTSLKKQAEEEKKSSKKGQLTIMDEKSYSKSSNHYRKEENFIEKDQKSQKCKSNFLQNPPIHPMLFMPIQAPTLNSNNLIIQQTELYPNKKVSLMLQQSEQCQFIDIQYLDHFKSFSFIDESLFQ